MTMSLQAAADVALRCRRGAIGGAAPVSTARLNP
jgi:hypothetical protein